MGLRIGRDRLAEADRAEGHRCGRICAPNNLHKEIAIAAAQAGKMILCEKPLAMNAAEGPKMVAAVEKAGVPNIVWYNYRRVPAVTFAKQLIDSGKLGRIFHYRANFLQDWTISADLPQGGAGAVAARRRRPPAAASPAICWPTASTRPLWLNGGIENVTAMTETFIKERKHNLTGKVEKVGIDDACAFLCRFANGSLATVRIDPLRPRPQGAVHVRNQRRKCLDQMGSARSASPGVVRSPRRRLAARLAQHPRHRRRSSLHGPLVGARPANRLRAYVRPSGRRFPEGLANGKPAGPTFREAQETQKICDAVLASAKSGQWTGVD